MFDIETVPDIEGLIRLGYGGEGADAQEVVQAYCLEKGRESDFLPHYLQKVVAISCVLREKKENGDRFRVWSLGAIDEPEDRLIQRFYDGIQSLKPQLVSWNGGGFDLPVLHYRALQYRISAPLYWEMGQIDRDFKFDNYVSRYHLRHIDLMDLLAMYQPRAFAPMDELARLCGFVGKLGMDGSAVFQNYQAGDIESIRAYCETDVVNTYLLYVNFEYFRGKLSLEAYQAELDFVAISLDKLEGVHWQEYLAAWKQTD